MASSGSVSDLQRQILELRNELRELKSSHKNLLSSLKHNEYGQPNSEDSTPVTTGDLDILIGGSNNTRARGLNWNWSTWQTSGMSLGIMSEIESPFYDSLEDARPGTDAGATYFALSNYSSIIRSGGLHTSEVLRDLEVYMTIPALKANGGNYDPNQAIEFKCPFNCPGIRFIEGLESSELESNMSIMPDLQNKAISFNSDTISFDSISDKAPIITSTKTSKIIFNLDQIFYNPITEGKSPVITSTGTSNITFNFDTINIDSISDTIPVITSGSTSNIIFNVDQITYSPITVGKSPPTVTITTSNNAELLFNLNNIKQVGNPAILTTDFLQGRVI